jgi:hypothetical protein
MSLSLEIADNGYLLEGVLVDPHGMQLSVEPNLDPAGNPQFALQMFKDSPEAGRWQFILLQNVISSGNQTTLPFSARVGFNGARVTATGLPGDASVKLSASKTATVTLNVVNTGAVTGAFFADARLTKYVATKLTPQTDCPAPPLMLPGTCADFVVPTEANNVQFVAQSTVPIQMDASNSVGFLVGFTGSPDIFAKRVNATTVMASISEPEVPFGTWFATPALIGPFGAAGAPSEPVKITATASIQEFDSNVTSDSGDLWADITLGTNTFSPLILGSGEAGTITLKIKPAHSQIGKVVNGWLYLDTFNPNVGSGDEVVRIFYSYTVVP